MRRNSARVDQELSLGRHRPTLSEVRKWASGRLAAESPDVVADVLLVVNELVSNAYRYAAGPSSVRVGCERDRIRIEVVHDPRTIARKQTRPAHGGGLMLVARLADRWGVERRHGGTTVWADIPRAS